MKTAFGGSRGRRLSPTPSVVDFVGGSRSSVAHADLEPADRCDATRGNLPIAWTRRRLLLPARGFALGLLRSLLRRGLRLRFGSLRHNCPPSHKRWRFRNSAVANRHALHSDYYSTMRKTATPLNKLWTAEAAAAIAVRASPRSPRATMLPADVRAARARKFHRPTKNPVAQWFPACARVRVACVRTAARRSATTPR